MDNIISLHYELVNLIYKHKNYQRFTISDPKSRIIHKTTVRDRLVHRAIHRIIYLFFDKTFISDSYSCRINKGTHKALIRYSDDFIILSANKDYLISIIPKIKQFLEDNLRLNVHPDKISIRTMYSGQDFLGRINFQDYRILRASTKRRMFKKIKRNQTPEIINSYLGLLKHGNQERVKQTLKLLGR